MPKFDALEEALDEDLVLPLRGADGQMRDYTITAPDWPTMLRARAMGHVADALSIGKDPDETQVFLAGEIGEEAVNTFALGDDTYQTMLADGVGAEQMARAITTALFFKMGSTAAAEAVWSGKAQNQKIRSAKVGGGGATTRPSTSGSGTSTRRKSRKN